nr:Anaphase-promoting complex (APC), subunit 11 [Ipomoea batatas]
METPKRITIKGSPSPFAFCVPAACSFAAALELALPINNARAAGSFVYWWVISGKENIQQHYHIIVFPIPNRSKDGHSTISIFMASALNSHPNYVIHITAQQQPYVDQDFSSNSPNPEFAGDFHVRVDFYSDDQTKKIPIPGLDLHRLFYVPCSPWNSKGIDESDVDSMLSFMRIPFPMNKLLWENTNSNPETVPLESKDDLLKTFLGFMNALKNQPANRDLMFLPVSLRIVKKVTISDFEFEAWVSWQEEQARVIPNFDEEYKKAIGRLRLPAELPDREMQPKPATASAMAALESWEVAGGGGSAITCSICLEEVVFGMKATGMQCSHVFHGDCILKWLKGDHTCPVCRYSLPFTLPSRFH